MVEADSPGPPARFREALTRMRAVIESPTTSQADREKLEKVVNLAEQRAVMGQVEATRRAKLSAEKAANPLPKEPDREATFNEMAVGFQARIDDPATAPAEAARLADVLHMMDLARCMTTGQPIPTRRRPNAAPPALQGQPSPSAGVRLIGGAPQHRQGRPASAASPIRGASESAVQAPGTANSGYWTSRDGLRRSAEVAGGVLAWFGMWFLAFLAYARGDAEQALRALIGLPLAILGVVAAYVGASALCFPAALAFCMWASPRADWRRAWLTIMGYSARGALMGGIGILFVYGLYLVVKSDSYPYCGPGIPARYCD